MSNEDLTELERALRLGPAHAQEDLRARGTSRAAQKDARDAARRFSERAGARGLADVNYASVDSPFGPLLLAGSGRGLLRLAFPEEEVDEVLDGLSRRVSPRIVEAPAQLDRSRRELDEYFAGDRHAFELPLDWTLVGPFGRRVLSAAAAIPYGDVHTYTQIATKAGSPRGSRAAGNALGANPIPIVVPCHRVLRGSGALGGYAGGLERKQFLLELEGAR
ncbi:MAG TPA: methylated-DNA--[protein]-cysteine S-methyltransferase [Solirubrobacteraceae bacterium]|nr:methylated-DNA--[protein]-cysteine S-methyltransferase [Solirubrobacteraceae bacterium]